MPTDSYAPLRRPAFRRYLTGAQAITLANQVMAITAGYHLYDLTHLTNPTPARSYLRRDAPHIGPDKDSVK